MTTSMTGATGGNMLGNATGGGMAGGGMNLAPKPQSNVPKGYKEANIQQFTPEQMALFQQLFSQVGPNSQLSKLAGGDQAAFNQIEAPALQQFNALQGNIASRFSGAGMGARRSSGFNQAIGQAGSDFAQQLQSQRQALQRQALMDMMGISGQLLEQRPQENLLVQKQKPWWQELLIGMGQGAAQGGSQAATMAMMA